MHSYSRKNMKMTRSDKSFQVTDKTTEVGPSQPLDREISLVAKPTPMEISSIKASILKGKKIIFSLPFVVETVKPRRAFTRSKTLPFVVETVKPRRDFTR
jgi:hypothetical protein